MNNKNYKIVDITSEYDVVINAGLDNNISEGTEFEIFVYGKEIIDPDTKESLGTLDIIKSVVEAVAVYPKICRCRHIDMEKKINYNTLVPGFPNFRNNEDVMVPVAKRLNIDYADIKPNIDIEMKIKVGDLVRIKKH